MNGRSAQHSRLLFWLAVAPGIGVIVKAFWDSFIAWFSIGISKGEWLQIATTILFALLSYYGAREYLNREKSPFKVYFSDLPYRAVGNKNYRRRKYLKCGDDQSFTMRFKLKIERKMAKLNLRPVNWKIVGSYDGEIKWFDYFDAPLGKITIMKVEGQEIGFERSDSDGKGGRTLQYRTTQSFAEGHSLWLTVTVNAPHDWRGYISLQLIAGDNRRGFGRAKVVVGKTYWRSFLEELAAYKQLI